MKTREEKSKRLPPLYEPGIIEVLFKDQAKIRLTKILPESRKGWNFTAKSESDLKALNVLLTKIESSMVSRIFTNSTEEEYDALHKKVKEKHPTVPNLNNFVVIHFPSTRDPVEMAKEFKRLPFVEKAYPVPVATPPDIARKIEGTELTNICRFATIIGPCRFFRVARGPCSGATPLNEPLTGNQDTVYTVDPTRNLENQWYIYRCNADSAWGLACGEGVVIADIDWGYRSTHDDLKNKFDLAHAYNSYDGGNNVSAGAYVYHGTGVTGLAGAEDNGTGMIGFAYGSTLWPIQANTGPGTPLGGDSWANAIDWVRAQSTTARKVIILEVQVNFGNIEMVASVNAAIINAIADGVVVCVAAGNGDRDADLDDSGNPISFTGSIVVGATAYDPTTNPRAWFSNWGTRVDVAAPGDSSHDLTCSDSADNAYTNAFGGTSGATPKVAGTVALMLQCNPNLTPAEVRDIIKTTASATVVTTSNKPIGGFLDTYAAVREACRRADPCRFSLIINRCRLLRVVDTCDISRIAGLCLKTNILIDPCKRIMIVDGCIQSRIIVGPCCTRELIAGEPFWHDEIFTTWSEAYENLRNETLKHFKRLTSTK